MRRQQADLHGYAMIEESSPRLLRYRLVESIVPLAAPAEQLVAYAHADDFDIDEPVKTFVDWTYDFIPRLAEQGMLPGNLAERLQLLFDQAIAAVQSAPYEACETAVLRPEWAVLRDTARSILERFRAAGVPIPDIGSGLLGDISTVPLSERE